MKATFWQAGNALDYQNTGNTVIEAGSVVDLNTRIGVAGTNIQPEQVGSVHVEGVFVMPKAAGAIALGAAVFYNSTAGNITTTGGGNTPAGYAVQAAAADGVTVYVKLLG
ncbi:MAG: DUF2190 family protein [Oscillospiraceae bacterium]|nr:DUF2190 family protein [Oscillospiraceae bacterium]